MAILMFASTVSWTIEKHYCLDFLIDIAFFHEAEGCCMPSVMDQNPVLTAIDDDSCCSDEVISVQGLDSLTFPDRDQIVVLPLFFVTPGLYGHLYFVAPEGRLLSPFDNYPPPLLVKDVHVLNEVFLI